MVEKARTTIGRRIMPKTSVINPSLPVYCAKCAARIDDNVSEIPNCYTSIKPCLHCATIAEETGHREGYILGCKEAEKEKRRRTALVEKRANEIELSVYCAKWREYISPNVHEQGEGEINVKPCQTRLDEAKLIGYEEGYNERNEEVEDLEREIDELDQK